MPVARHALPRSRFRDKKPDWNAFEHRFIGGGCCRKHEDPSVITARGFTMSIMYVEPGESAVFVEDEHGNREQTRPSSLEPVYLQVMLGKARPDTMGYADEALFARRAAHLKAG